MSDEPQNFDANPLTRLGGFEILEKIGEGGMGAVYRARQKSLDRIVALKILTSKLSSDAKYIDSFLREARSAAGLHHSNVVSVIDAGEADGVYYYAMEFISGETLLHWVQREGTLPETTALGIGLCVANALKHAWDKEHLIHRDVKPENVMVDADGNVKLCDLGLSKNFGETTLMSVTGNVCGTPQFMSPEQARADREVDCRSDIYSLGMTLYFALTAQIPFNAGTPTLIMARHLTEQLADPREFNKTVSFHTARVLEKMLAKNAEERYETWDEVLRDLQLAIEHEAPKCPMLPPGRSTLRRNAVTGLGKTAAPAIVEPFENAPLPMTVTLPVPTPTAAPPKSRLVPRLVGLAVIFAIAGVAGFVIYLKNRPETQPPMAGNNIVAGTPSTLTPGGNVVAVNPPLPPVEPPKPVEIAKPVEVPKPVEAAKPPAPQQHSDSIPLDTLEKIKGATVFIKVEAGRAESSGSGFIIKADGNTRYLVTNDHVITPPRELGVSKPIITVVFRSGTKQEQSVRAEVLATDKSRDLAVLKVAGPNLPLPLDIEHKPRLIETMPVFIFGFPFGEMLSTTQGNPAISVGKGAVSSVRLDEFGDLAVVQIDGALNPGNSGGPVVDSQGLLVGVSVATIRGTGIGMAIPPTELVKMLNGRVGRTSLTTRKIENDTAEITVEASLIDPMNTIRSVILVYVRADIFPGPLKANADGTFPPLPGGKKVDLVINQQKAFGSVDMPSSGKNAALFWVQTGYVDGEGKTLYTEPGPYKIDFANKTAAMPSGDNPVEDERRLEAERRLAERQAIEEASQQALMQAFADFTRPFLDTLAKRDYAGAEKLAQDAAASPALASLKNRVGEFHGVARQLNRFWTDLPVTLQKIKGQKVTLQGTEATFDSVRGNSVILERKIGENATAEIEIAIAKLTLDELMTLTDAAAKDRETAVALVWILFAENQRPKANARLDAAEKAGADVKSTRELISVLVRGLPEVDAEKTLVQLRAAMEQKQWQQARALLQKLDWVYGATAVVKDALKQLVEFETTLNGNVAPSDSALREELRALRDDHFIKPRRTAIPKTYMKVASERGDYIGAGKTYFYKAEQLKTRGNDKGVFINVAGWGIEFTPIKSQSLKEGEFPNAKRSAFRGESPGINFSGDGRGCNQITGKFVIWELEFEGGNITKLAIDFLQSCENNMPPLVGKLRVNSSYR